MNQTLFFERVISYCPGRRMLVVFAVLFFCLAQQSCVEDRELAEGSFDTSKTSEGGASATVDKDLFGWNVMHEWNIGLGGYSSKSSQSNSSSGGKAWLPYDYTAAPAAAGGSWRTANQIGLVQKGYKNDGTSVRMNYLEVSQKILYNYEMADKSSLYGGLGPYFAYGIGGKASGNGFSESTFGGEDGYKRFDAGLRIGVGYYMSSGLDFQLNYDLGLTNISPAPDFTSHTRSFGFSVGYSIPKIIAAFKGKK